MKRAVAFLLLLVPATARAQSIQLPATVTVPQPGLVVVTPTTVDADCVRWFSLDPGLQLIPNNLLKSDQTAVGVAVSTGTYRLRAVAAKDVGGKAAMSPVAECVVTVGQGPTPPNPPNPPDTFLQAVTAAYQKEADPKKAQYVAWLKTIYQTAGAKVTPGMTAGQLFTLLQSSIHDPTWGFPKGTIPALMKVIDDDLDITVGGKVGPIDASTPVDPAKVQAAFVKYVAALGALK